MAKKADENIDQEDFEEDDEFDEDDDVDEFEDEGYE